MIGKKYAGWWPGIFCDRGSERGNVLGLRTFLPHGDFHGDFLTFFQRPSSSPIDGAEMDEHILTAGLFNEAETFFVIEPLNGTFNSLCHIFLVQFSG